MKKFALYLEEVRAPFFTASIVPVILGASVAWYHTGRFHWGLFLLALAGGVLLHAGTNVANDFFDHKSGDDRLNVDYVRPFTGGSRMIQRGLLTPKEVLWESILAYLGAVAIGVVLTVHRGYPILILGGIGMFCGYFYTGTPLVLAARGVGELVIGGNFGILMTIGSYYVQTGRFSLEAALAGVPVALLILLVIFINEFQDMKADALAGKRTLVVRLDRKRSSRLYLSIMLLTYMWILVFACLRLIGPFALLAILSVPIAARATAVALACYERPEALAPANAGTIMTHLSVGILISIGYVLQSLFS
ncbi:MAG: 1,4-dihydroxy-2-naphthoate octaprenyltransferase [bacterium]